jgi:hypothetical protein
MFQKLVFAVTGFLLLQCSKKEELPPSLPFEAKPVTSPVTAGFIDEASGITASRSNPGSLWVQQDGGNPAEIILISNKGVIQKRMLLKGAYNRDWEDIACGAGPVADSNYIYIAETGDNSAVHSVYSIYRFLEPDVSADTVLEFDKINFKYPDGPHDAEALFLSREKDIYIITKRDSVAAVYKLPFPQSTSVVTTATKAGSLKFTGVTGAACSAPGNEILIRTYTGIYYWKLNGTETPEAALKRSPLQLGYEQEPQGEAVCFEYNNGGFFTLSEKPFFATSVSLNYYKRK